MLFFALPLLVAAQAPAAAETPKTCRIAVLDLIGRGLSDSDKDFPLLLSEVMANEVASASKCQVISQSDIKSMVDFEATRSSCAEGGESCLAELGQALGVDRIVAGSIGKLGSDYVITVRLVDIARAVVEQRAEEVVSGQPERLRLAAKLVGRALFPHTTPAIEHTEPGKDGKPTSSESSVISPLLIGGVGVGAVGLVGAIIGVAMAVDADGKLGTPANTDKAGAFAQAQTGVAIGVGGVAAAVVGGVVSGLAFTSPDL